MLMLFLLNERVKLHHFNDKQIDYILRLDYDINFQQYKYKKD